MTESPPTFVEQLGADVAEVTRLHGLIEGFCEEHGVHFAVVNAINLSLDEVLTNIINHGASQRDDGSCAIEVRVTLLDQHADGQLGLRVEVEDDTGAFNMLDAEEPDTLAPIEQRNVGGLGIYLVKQMMDRLDYERRDHRNLVVMEKSARP